VPARSRVGGGGDAEQSRDDRTGTVVWRNERLLNMKAS
jgi:hypothetical protein